MITVTVTFDTHAVSRDDYVKILRSGTVLSASGLLNLRWEDFSALDTAREFNLRDVAWEATRDDTPGILTCIIRYENAILSELAERFHEPPVLEYEIYEATRHQ